MLVREAHLAWPDDSVASDLLAADADDQLAGVDRQFDLSADQLAWHAVSSAAIADSAQTIDLAERDRCGRGSK